MRLLLALMMAVALTAACGRAPDTAPTVGGDGGMPVSGDASVAPDDGSVAAGDDSSDASRGSGGQGGSQTDQDSDGSSTNADGTVADAGPANSGGDSSGNASGDQSSGGRNRGGGSSGSTSKGSFSTVAASDDRNGDAGLQVPAYADITSVRLADDGTRARVIVQVGADLPARFPDGEVIGIGFDVYTEGNRESTYQLFATGNADGWEPFLQRADDVYQYPGQFRVTGRRVVFTLDWSFIGQLPQGSYSAFVDWSRERVPLNESGGDRTPDRGVAGFRR